MKEKILRAGIIGAGRVAWRYDGGRWEGGRSVSHAACFDRHPQTKLVAVLDSDETALEDVRRALGAGIVATSDAKIFFNEQLDLISICSPSGLHAAHIDAALDAGADYLWIEKPVTSNLQDYKNILSRFRQMQSPPHTLVNYIRRGLPQFELLRSYCQRPDLRGLDFIYSRGIAINGVHLLDLLGYLTDSSEPSALSWIEPGDGINPSFGIKVGKVEAVFRGFDLPYHCIECRATFEDGRITALAGGAQLIFEPRVANEDYPGFSLLGGAKELLPRVNTEDALRDATYIGLCALLENKLPRSDLETAFFSQALLDQIEKAINV